MEHCRGTKGLFSSSVGERGGQRGKVWSVLSVQKDLKMSFSNRTMYEEYAQGLKVGQFRAECLA